MNSEQKLTKYLSQKLPQKVAKYMCMERGCGSQEQMGLKLSEHMYEGNAYYRGLHWRSNKWVLGKYKKSNNNL